MSERLGREDTPAAQLAAPIETPLRKKEEFFGNLLNQIDSLDTLPPDAKKALIRQLAEALKAISSAVPMAEHSSDIADGAYQICDFLLAEPGTKHLNDLLGYDLVDAFMVGLRQIISRHLNGDDLKEPKNPIAIAHPYKGEVLLIDSRLTEEQIKAKVSTIEEEAKNFLNQMLNHASKTPVTDCRLVFGLAKIKPFLRDREQDNVSIFNTDTAKAVYRQIIFAAISALRTRYRLRANRRTATGPADRRSSVKNLQEVASPQKLLKWWIKGYKDTFQKVVKDGNVKRAYRQYFDINDQGIITPTLEACTKFRKGGFNSSTAAQTVTNYLRLINSVDFITHFLSQHFDPYMEKMTAIGSLLKDLRAMENGGEIDKGKLKKALQYLCITHKFLNPNPQESEPFHTVAALILANNNAIHAVLDEINQPASAPEEAPSKKAYVEVDVKNFGAKNLHLLAQQFAEFLREQKSKDTPLQDEDLFSFFERLNDPGSIEICNIVNQVRTNLKAACPDAQIIIDWSMGDELRILIKGEHQQKEGLECSLTVLATNYPLRIAYCLNPGDTLITTLTATAGKALSQLKTQEGSNPTSPSIARFQISPSPALAS